MLCLKTGHGQVWNGVKWISTGFSFYRRSEGNISQPCWYFTWNINGQLVAGRYINSLCNSHGLNIA